MSESISPKKSMNNDTNSVRYHLHYDDRHSQKDKDAVTTSRNIANVSALPSAFSLRLPATLLSQLHLHNHRNEISFRIPPGTQKQHLNDKSATKNTEWILMVQNKNNTSLTDNVNHKDENTNVHKKGDLKIQEYPMKLDPNHFNTLSYQTDIFYNRKEQNNPKIQSINPDRNLNGNRNLFCIGNISKQFTISAKDTTNISANRLDHIRKKTRELGLLEKRNRKEIVRIDLNEPAPLIPSQLRRKRKQQPSSLSAFANAIKETHAKTTNTTASTKKKKTISPQTSVTKPINRSTEILKTNTDYNTSNCATEDKSNIVRLHGLPNECKPEYIRMFFKGLDPKRIFMLPYYNHFVSNFDDTVIKYHHHASKKRTRHKSNLRDETDTSLRVFVKFHSTPMAESAFARSGESLQYRTNVGNDDDGDGDNYVSREAVVGITRVSRELASFLQKNMAIDGIRGESLTTTLHRIHQQLPPHVETVLWQVAMKRFDMKLLQNNHENKDIPNLFTTTYSFKGSTRMNEYKRVAQSYNSLLDLYESLEKQTLPFWIYSSLNPTEQQQDSLSTNINIDFLCVQRLIIAADEGVLDEMERIELILKRMRHIPPST